MYILDGITQDIHKYVSTHGSVNLNAFSAITFRFKTANCIFMQVIFSLASQASKIKSQYRSN